MPDEKEKTAVRINYSSPGAQPPIYIAGSFTNPPWQPMVLQYAVDESLAHTKDEHIKAKEYRFYTDLQVAEGRWEYKFRLGIGDWWACDTRLETVLDNSGNENNLLVVKSGDRPFSQPNDTDTQAVRDRDVTTVPRTLEHPKHPSLVEEKPLSNTAECLRKGLIPNENNLSHTKPVNGSNQNSYGLSKLQENLTEKSDTTITSLIGSDVTPNCRHGEQRLGNEKDEDTPLETNHYQSSSESRIRPNGNRRRETEEKGASNEKPQNSEISENNVKSIWQWFVSWISFVYIRILGKRD